MKVGWQGGLRTVEIKNWLTEHMRKDSDPHREKAKSDMRKFSKSIKVEQIEISLIYEKIFKFTW